MIHLTNAEWAGGVVLLASFAMIAVKHAVTRHLNRRHRHG